ncbi:MULTISPECIES: FtsK/SpoIIIE family DNA translocase [Weeksella]|uniref:Cell division protein FtsK/SpoIIIE n=1 Tax=Weeksella virosa (strain ATCC 43766 / DSM 16922 / JCM 21250 / CCUG 30538 / CDC 9751 / IAM 14551 / NBRC 16016 / NCTC 11634 / CL345/78) TaxID=865938 RepID=F0P0Q8_WEEVC|nr:MULTISPECIES: DNA translocase FtsK [Weeksella]ADX67472.1 cell division protein FtsK/SpoIIIE [Weeksella virosa DSM 16922]MDK7675754.1 DNA translocase FtsK [Weeksella virosa]OFM82174.1 cell division protein FtsK [Weeksella sp. HMSC059D05]VEH62785.1 Stage III sporulation protein E [Weeksella virosa]
MTIRNTEPDVKTSKKKTFRTIIGILIISLGFTLFLSLVSYLINSSWDQSQIYQLTDKSIEAENIFGKLGALLGEIFVRNGIGIAAFFFPIFLIILGLKVLTRLKKIKPFHAVYNWIFFLIWGPILLGFIFPNKDILSGAMGFEVNDFLNSLIGKIGVGMVLFVSFLIYAIVHWRLSYENITHKLETKREIKKQKRLESDLAEKEKAERENNDPFEEFNHPTREETKLPTEKKDQKIVHVLETHTEEEDFLTDAQKIEEYEKEASRQNKKNKENEISTTLYKTDIPQPYIEKEESGEAESIELKIEQNTEEEVLEEISENLVKKHGEYDPHLDLPNYQFPPLSLLTKYSNASQTTIDQRELDANKNKIVDTLANYGIGISQIKATIGPTVTLYEIVPEAGIRISKIKNLEDDIALSLSALGIRIIAPIPGRGTIGIEVPNSNPSIVSMHSVIASAKFQSSTMELPIAFGKTISNETFVADLAKMPHLLMAGATGQGKSVGLNAIITSLIYKKHPSELKFVLVDPKKVELTLYSKIERHYLAKLPDSDEAIITDNTKVINTLNSLCIEMDERYELLKNAYVRNIKEYNAKFKQRKLNPENGHRFLPYIVLVVDEFADLIMTAGKEVELPIARLAQLARAVGIHLIIATQRPSVNVITGTIKANFPGRVAFRVTSKIDSRTILDSSGADQLIGKGDMLFTTGNDLVRIQCAFVDTPEVDKITEFIGNQKGYPDALHLPEYEGEESSASDIDLSERDALFEEAAKIIITAQQGSASLLQRKLKVGYNRAGRLIDQLEAAGIVGPFEGSKARQVLIQDELSLEQLLSNLD